MCFLSWWVIYRNHQTNSQQCAEIGDWNWNQRCKNFINQLNAINMETWTKNSEKQQFLVCSIDVGSKLMGKGGGGEGGKEIPLLRDFNTLNTSATYFLFNSWVSVAEFNIHKNTNEYNFFKNYNQDYATHTF